MGCGVGGERLGDRDWGRVLKGFFVLLFSFIRFFNGRYNMVGVKIKYYFEERVLGYLRRLC